MRICGKDHLQSPLPPRMGPSPQFQLVWSAIDLHKSMTRGESHGSESGESESGNCEIRLFDHFSEQFVVCRSDEHLPKEEPLKKKTVQKNSKQLGKSKMDKSGCNKKYYFNFVNIYDSKLFSKKSNG